MKITVITVCLNKGSEIERTIKSVISQTYQNIEYWIIDGLSTDGTINILKRYKKHLNFISEKDKGIYEAMNKGIEKATGDYLLFLNAGDYFLSDYSVDILALKNSGEDLIYGNILVREDEFEWTKLYPNLLSVDYFLKDTLPHPATLIKRLTINRIGRFNIENTIVSDWEFFMTAVCKFKVSYKYVNATITVFYANGISSDPKNRKVILEEKLTFLKKNFLKASTEQDFLKAHGIRSRLNPMLVSMHSFLSNIRRIWTF